jgi:hypothetical protein
MIYTDPASQGDPPEPYRMPSLRRQQQHFTLLLSMGVGV